MSKDPVRSHLEAEAQKRAFKAKLRTIQFSAGAKTYPKNYYDSEALDDSFGPDREGYVDEVTHGVGPLKRGPDGFYKKNRHGEYERATEKDVDELLYEGPAYEPG